MAEFTKVCRFLRHRKREDLAELLANARATYNLLDVGGRGEEVIAFGEVTLWFPASAETRVQGLTSDDERVIWEALAGIPQIKPTFLEIAPSGIPSNIIPHSKGVQCGLIRSNSPFSYSNHRPAKPKIPKPLVYAQVSPLGTSFATP